MPFNELFPQAGGGSPSPGGAPAQAPAQGGGLPGAEGQPGQTPPSAQAVIDQFVAYAKSQNIPEEEVVGMIMEAIIAAGYQPPPEEKVAEMVNKSYQSTPAAAGPAPGGPMGGAQTAPPAQGPAGGGVPLA